jgi:hypothetical protein
MATAQSPHAHFLPVTSKMTASSLTKIKLVVTCSICYRRCIVNAVEERAVSALTCLPCRE